MRLLVHVEGQTEETFVNEVLASTLLGKGYSTVSARIVGNARERHRRGGIKPWPAVRQDIIRHLRQDSGCIATTMVDYYGLPADGPKAWPGRAEAAGVIQEYKASTVEEALMEDISGDLTNAQARRFLPFVMMHEFEALLFSDCGAFAKAIGSPQLEPAFQEIRNAFDTPECINDSPITAPSKRVIALVPGYEKPLHGNVAALGVGLASICEECPHFANWLFQLEALVA